MLYLWGLGSSGWANSYYAAAAQAGTQDWKAWLFGSLDAGNAITVDKPPAAMWVMGLSGRLFGFNEFTMLLPEALMGVAAVALLYFTVRRTSGASAGLIAGVVLALTPVATLMFRYNNPDALLVLLLVVAAYCTVRAIDASTARRMTMWMALTGAAIGFAFLTKMLQAFLVVPGLALAFLVAAPFGMWKRLGALLIGGATMIVSAGWYVALVSLWPADSRPYIAGSTDNSLLQLAFGYNGIQRIAGNEGGGPGGGPGPDRWRCRWHESVLRRRPWHRSAVRRLHGRRGVMAAARRPHRPGRRTVADLARGAYRSGQGRTIAMGRLAFGDRRGVQLHGGHRAPVLQRRAGSRGRRAGGHRGRSAVAAQRIADAAAGARRDVAGDRGVVLRAAEPDARVVAGAALGRARRIDPARRAAGGSRTPPRQARRPPSRGCGLFGLGGPAAFSIYDAASTHSGPGTMSGPQKAGGFGGPSVLVETGGPGMPGRVDSPELEALLTERRQPLGSSGYRIDVGERPRTEDR